MAVGWGTGSLARLEDRARTATREKSVLEVSDGEGRTKRKLANAASRSCSFPTTVREAAKIKAGDGTRAKGELPAKIARRAYKEFQALEAWLRRLTDERRRARSA